MSLVTVMPVFRLVNPFAVSAIRPIGLVSLFSLTNSQSHSNKLCMTTTSSWKTLALLVLRIGPVLLRLFLPLTQRAFGYVPLYHFTQISMTNNNFRAARHLPRSTSQAPPSRRQNVPKRARLVTINLLGCNRAQLQRQRARPAAPKAIRIRRVRRLSADQRRPRNPAPILQAETVTAAHLIRRPDPQTSLFAACGRSSGDLSMILRVKVYAITLRVVASFTFALELCAQEPMPPSM